ncbi:hypothetical protein [Marinobacter sp. OP 3.4]|uniref:hypothetical protein n=1 Tax=Marinobacter sp. OP 3.4 TaxID=3076501 RepID=UPI002E22E484
MTLMMNLPGLAVAIFLPIVIVGCASQEATTTKSPAQAYGNYLMLTDNEAPLEELAGQWDEPAQDMFLRTADSSGKSIPIDNFESSLRYPLLFSDAPTAPESIEMTGGESCMLLVGQASDGGVLALSVLLKESEGQWKHSELFARYLGPGDSRPTTPLCLPPEPFSS